MLAIINNAALNIGVHMFSNYCLFSVDIYPGVGVLDHMVILFLIFLRKLHTVLHDGYTNLHLHQQCGMMPFIHIFTNTSVQFSSSLSRVRLFATPWTAARQASLSISDSWSLLKLMSIESVMPSNQLILCCPVFLPLQSFPASPTHICHLDHSYLDKCEVMFHCGFDLHIPADY